MFWKNTPLTPRKTLRAGAAVIVGLCLTLGGLALTTNTQAQSAPACELKRPVRFGGMSWESNLVLVEIERFIMEKGYGCATEVLPTETLTALAALDRGDLDINSELWINGLKEPWEKALAAGTVARVGDVFTGREGWFIPRYTAERLPELKRAADLPKYKDHFKDPEEPSKGRFYGCPSGWACEIINANQFRGLGMQDSFTFFSPGSGASQKAALMSAYQRQENVVFYYWAPTPLMGMMDLVELEFPPQDDVLYRCIADPDCADPKASAFFDNPVFTAVSTRFLREAPTLNAFLADVSVPVDLMNKVLAYLEETQEEPDAAAQWFLRNAADVWTQWVPADVAARVKAAL